MQAAAAAQKPPMTMMLRRSSTWRMQIRAGCGRPPWTATAPQGCGLHRLRAWHGHRRSRSRSTAGSRRSNNVLQLPVVRQGVAAVGRSSCHCALLPSASVKAATSVLRIVTGVRPTPLRHLVQPSHLPDTDVALLKLIIVQGRLMITCRWQLLLSAVIGPCPDQVNSQR